GLLLTIDFR
ncbi:hypothetical protein D039_1270B, partial [Vibrio parahaemolyticus EKP-028]